MSNKSENGNHSISQAEITELGKYLNDLLKEIDIKTTSLLNASFPDKVVDDCNENELSNIIKYTSSPDSDNIDITNVAAYQEIDELLDPVLGIEGNDHCSNVNDEVSSTDFDSIDSDIITLFSPVCPEPLVSQACPEPPTFNDVYHPDFTGSLETISTVSTISRPPIEANKAQAIAFEKLETSPFHLFNMFQLDSTTTEYKKLGKRLVAYYGDYPYTYSSTEHAPRKFEENPYLMHILSYIRIVIPELKFNSAMVHKYVDGHSFMPHHSDNESCIENGSDIVSISLGDSRCIEFVNKDNGESTQVQLGHGDVLTMSRSSQEMFTHAILSEPGKESRISITLRLIKPPGNEPQRENRESTEPANARTEGYQDTHEPHIHLNTIHSTHAINPQVEPPTTVGYQEVAPESGPIVPGRASWHTDSHRVTDSPFHWQREGWQPPRTYPPRSLPPRSNPTLPVPPRQSEPPRQTIQNKSGMFPPGQLHPSRRQTNFRSSDFKPFSTKQRQDIVFISSSMFANLDPTKLSSNEVNAHVFFYRGADSYQMMDRLRRDAKVQELAKQRSVSQVFLMTGTNNVDNICNNSQSMRDACSSISQTISFVQSLFSSATVNIINILPRAQENRKKVIEQLNSHIKNFVIKERSERLYHVDTYTYKLFTSYDGTRKSDLFRKNHFNGTDNVHLNNI